MSWLRQHGECEANEGPPAVCSQGEAASGTRPPTPPHPAPHPYTSPPHPTQPRPACTTALTKYAATDRSVLPAVEAAHELYSRPPGCVASREINWEEEGPGL